MHGWIYIYTHTRTHIFIHSYVHESMGTHVIYQRTSCLLTYLHMSLASILIFKYRGQKGYMGPSSHGPSNRRRSNRGPVLFGLSCCQRQGPWPVQSPVTEAGYRKMECYLSCGEGTLAEVERYLLNIVSLTSTHSSGSGTSLLERGGHFFYAGVVPGERQRAGVGPLIAPIKCVGVYPCG